MVPQLRNKNSESVKRIENLNMFRHNLKHFDNIEFEYCDKRFLLTAVYRKPTYRRNFQYNQSVHLKSLQGNITFSQGLHLK